ncbi:ATP-binding protein [Adhaeribacter aquaticus]|uniref:ATP-binding protein n=1 Tax=Adhaeribacter aquaticus TaxID=299567 RepID=UPI000406E357|nr:ATP-binding protein [Adhaeribacter aquaticus]
MQNYQNLQVDLSNCDKEPIHIIGRIQPHGFLLIIDKATTLLEQVSQNTYTFLDLTPEQLLNQPVTQLFSSDEAAFITELLWQEEPGNPHLISLNNRRFFCFIHASEEKLILEGEPFITLSDNDKLEDNNLLSQLKLELNKLSRLDEVANLVAQTILQILNYDRVEIIQFDPEWNSEVIAEALTEKQTSYFGHHFPASDIPVQARAILETKHIRQIPDVDAAAVNLIPYFNPSTGNPINIHESELRNPSEIHLEYLKNMGVGASISFSIMVKGILWGIITCHNAKPVFVNVWKRQLGDLITKTFANVIASIQEKRNIQELTNYRYVKDELVAQISKANSLCKGLLTGKYTLLDITEGTGVAIFLDNKLHTIGQTPPEKEIMAILEWLSQHNKDAQFCTRELSKKIPEATHYKEVASGLLAIEISRYNLEYLLFFKPEIKETRIWAGNPEKPELGKDARIHPRKSFENWKEIIQEKSMPWSQNEQEITQILLKDIVALRLRNQTIALQHLNELLQNKNRQLEDFAHIMSHNLRSPLISVDGLMEYYEEEPDLDTASFVMKHIKAINKNMFHTVEDLNIILKTRIDEQVPAEEIDLLQVIEKEKENLGAAIIQTEAQLEFDLQVPYITLPKIYLESILHNLISNALKYRSPHRQPLVKIKSWEDNRSIFLSVSDNGLGMDLKKVEHKLFGLYKTFHVHENAKGLGLYLTKIQIEALGGEIQVESEPDKGTTFIVSFKL